MFFIWVSSGTFVFCCCAQFFMIFASYWRIWRFTLGSAVVLCSYFRPTEFICNVFLCLCINLCRILSIFLFEAVETVPSHFHAYNPRLFLQTRRSPGSYAFWTFVSVIRVKIQHFVSVICVKIQHLWFLNSSAFWFYDCDHKISCSFSAGNF